MRAIGASALSSALLDATWISVRVAATATAIDAVPAIALGWWLSRRSSVFAAAVVTVVSLPLVLPPVAVGLVLLNLLARDGLGGRLFEAVLGHSPLLTIDAAILAAAVMAFPLFVLGAREGFAAVPRRFELVAASLGASSWSAWREVALPLATRGILHGAVFAFARALGEFGATILVAGRIPGQTETLALATYDRIQHFEDAQAWRFVAVSIVFALVLAFSAERFLRRRAP